MKATVTITGSSIVVKNMKGKQSAIQNAVTAGLFKSLLELQRQSQLLAPVEFGNLKASATARMDSRFSGFVAYTAAYALLVHERVGMVLQGLPRLPSPPHIGRYWDLQGQAQAKFLEAPARNFKPTFAQIVGNEVKGAIK